MRGYPLTQIIENLSFVDSFYLLIRGELPTPEQSRVLNAILNGVLDYALYKPGTVAARIAVSANPSMVAGLIAAIASVGQHTLDPRDSGEFVLRWSQAHSESGRSLEDFAAGLVNRFRSEKKRIPGFGHPAWEYRDPRAQQLRAIAEANGVVGEKVRFYESVHAAFVATPGRETIPINDVGMMGVLLAEMGFTPDEMTGIAIASTVPGLIAQISEELQQGTRIRVVDESLQRYEGAQRRDLPCDIGIGRNTESNQGKGGRR
jgi:citrate synthase